MQNVCPETISMPPVKKEFKGMMNKTLEKSLIFIFETISFFLNVLHASFMTLASHIILWWENRSDSAYSMEHKTKRRLILSYQRPHNVYFTAIYNPDKIKTTHFPKSEATWRQ